MHKDQLYPRLDAIKLAMETSLRVLELKNDPCDYDNESKAALRVSAKNTLDIAQRRMREALDLDFDTMGYKTEDND